MANIIISTHWSDGDVVPFIAIGKYLKRIGHEVTIFTHCCYEERIKKEGVKFVPWDTIDEYKDFFNALVNFSNTVSSIQEIEDFREKYENDNVRLREYELIEPYCRREDTILIAKNRSSIAALLIAEKLNIPIIWVYMNPYEYGSIENFNNINGKKLCEEANILREKVGLEAIDSWLDWQKSPKNKVGLWPKWYKTSMVNVSDDIDLIGFPLEHLSKDKLSLPNELSEILREDLSPIIISGGSSNKIKKDFYELAIKSASAFGRNVIVATKYRELLPKKIPSNVYIFNYIPLYESLFYASCIINHGGIGTISNAIKSGVPQLVFGNYFDSPLNGSIVKNIGLGEYLPSIKWNEGNISECINKILTADYKVKCERFAEEHKYENTFEDISKIVEDVKKSNMYLTNKDKLINVNKELNHNSKGEGKKLDSLSKDMKRYILEKIKKGKEKGEQNG